jgi:hypothetical protein
MSGINASEVRLAPFGRIRVGPVGSVIPDDVTTPFDSDWFELGYVDEDGVSFNPDLATNDIRMWQALPPVKTTATGLSLEVSFNMGQVNQGTTSLYFFGAEWVDVGGGVAKLDVRSDLTLPERALAIEWNDDEGSINRFIIPRGFVDNRETMQLQRSNATLLGVTFKALDDSGDFFHLLSNNPALVPESS